MHPRPPTARKLRKLDSCKQLLTRKQRRAGHQSDRQQQLCARKFAGFGEADTARRADEEHCTDVRLKCA